MSSNRGRSPRAVRAELGRLIGIGLLAALMVGAARAVIAQEAPAEPTAEAPSAPAPAPTPAAGSRRPSVEVSADAAVDFPGDI